MGDALFDITQASSLACSVTRTMTLLCAHHVQHMHETPCKALQGFSYVFTLMCPYNRVKRWVCHSTRRQPLVSIG